MNAANKILFPLNLLLAAVLVTAIWRFVQRTPHQPAPAKLEPVVAETVAAPAQKLRLYSELGHGIDWRQWIEQLRDLGVPGPVLARLVQAGFEERWRKQEAVKAQADYMKGAIDTDGLAVVSIQHDREAENAMRAALGEAEFKAYDMQIVLRGLPLREVTLTSSESESIYEIEKRMQHLIQDVSELRFKGRINQTECDERLQQAQLEHDQELKAVLGEQRYAAMHPPPNEAAEKLRKDFRQVALPAEVSFDTLVGIQSQWNERRAEAQARLQEARTRIGNCEDELQKINATMEFEYERVLGSNDIAAGVTVDDPRLKLLKTHADDWGLDNAAQDYVLQTVQYYEKSLENYRRQTQALDAKGEAVDWDSVNRNLQRFVQQTEQQLQGYLGQDRYARLQDANIFPFAQKSASLAN